MNKTQTPELEIRLDGVLQEPSLAERAGYTAVSLVQAAGRVVTGYVGNVALNIREDVELGVFDLVHNTHLYTQKYDSLRQERIADKMRSLHLVQ